MDAVKPCWYVFFTSCPLELWHYQSVGFFRALVGTWGTAGLDIGQQHPGTLQASQQRNMYCWDVSAHVSWAFNETWWNLATFLDTHAGSFTVPSQYNKAQEFVSCCEEKSGIMLHINNFRIPSKCKKKLYSTLILVFLEWIKCINFLFNIAFSLQSTVY